MIIEYEFERRGKKGLWPKVTNGNTKILITMAGIRSEFGTFDYKIKVSVT
jgi:hypothetical protein